MWGAKTLDYIFPWEGIDYSTSKKLLWEAYQDHTNFVGREYCIATRQTASACHGRACGACSDHKTGEMKPQLIQQITVRKPAEIITADKIAATAVNAGKVYQMRVLIEVPDPIHRFVLKPYWGAAVPRAFMRVAKPFQDAFSHVLTHARTAAGAAGARDWTFGRNIYDFALSDHLSEAYLRDLLPVVNRELTQGQVLDVRVQSEMNFLRNDIDYVVYSMLLPAAEMSYGHIRSDVARYGERMATGKISRVKVKKAIGKDVFETIEKDLSATDVRVVSYEWLHDERATLLRFVVTPSYNPYALLEAITARAAASWRRVAAHVDAYVQVPENTGEHDIFSILAGTEAQCQKCGGSLERDVFTGAPLTSGVCLVCDVSQFPVDPRIFYTREMQAVEVQK